MIRKIKFRAGSDASVMAFVTEKKPTDEWIKAFDAKFQAQLTQSGHTYSEWPVKAIRHSDVTFQREFILDLWNGETCTVYNTYYIMETDG